MADLIKTVLWEFPGFGAERCTLERTDWGYRLAGTVLAVGPDGPARIDYSVLVDGTWFTRSAEADIDGQRFELSTEGPESWSAPNLEGCIDVDLGFSPSTNTLPIRRLGLAVGEEAEVAAAWLRWPELTLERLDQRYERIAEDRYRYTSPGFEAEITVDEHGLVDLRRLLAYGRPGLDGSGRKSRSLRTSRRAVPRRGDPFTGAPS